MKTDTHYFIIPRSVLLQVRNATHEILETVQTNLIFSIYFFLQSCLSRDNVEKNIVQLGRPQMTIWRVRIAYWIPKATNTYSEYVMLIAFPLQQRLHEGALMLR